MDRDALIALLTRIANTAGLPPAIFIAIAEWESGLNPDQLHDQGRGAGLFACHTEGRGAGYTIEELKDPELNAQLSADELGPIWKDSKAAGKSDAEAIKDLWVLGQRPEMSTPAGAARTNNAIRYTIEQAGVELGVEVSEPSRWTGPRFEPTAAPRVEAAGELARPRPEDFVNPLDYWTALSMYEDIKAGAPSVGPDEIDYLNAAINLIAAQLSEEQIDVAKADLELQKRLGALEEAGRTYRELAPYALPEGTKWIPGGEPGGIYERLGLGTMPAATTRVNPLAAALAVMGKTPEVGPTPGTSFEAALAGAQQLRGGMGAAPTVAPAVPPPHLEAALATAAAPESPLEARARVEREMQPPAPVPATIPTPTYEPTPPLLPKTTVSSEEPPNPTEGDVWVKSVMPELKFEWRGGRWVMYGR